MQAAGTHDHAGVIDLEHATWAYKAAANVPRVTIRTEEDEEKILSPSTKMAVALMFKGHVYSGTVSAHVKAARRRRNKAARLARRALR